MRLAVTALLLSVVAAAASAEDPASWGKEPIDAVSGTRGSICLNGVWRFIPMRDKAETEPSDGMVGIHVPGSWISSGSMPGLVSGPGTGPTWAGWGNGDGAWCAWYQRTIVIPPAWAGRAILVSLERVSTDALVYANGVKCGAVGWPYGEVDISTAVKPGEPAVLRIQVMATSDATPATSFLDPGRVVTTAAKLSSKGLIGEVFLASRPPGAHVSDVFVQTSTRRKELKLDVEVSDVAAAGPVQFTARIIGGNGQEEKRFTGTATLKEGRTQTVQLSWPWDKPQLWDFQQPNLYTLKLAFTGAAGKDECAQTFGFREFWIDGRKLMLNGSEIRIRPLCHTYMEGRFAGSVELTDAHIDGCMHAGFNCEECWPIDQDVKGTVIFRELWAERADLKGFLLMGTALPLDQGRWEKADYRDGYRRKLALDLRRYRNHPSIVMWTTNPNWLGNGLDQDPWHIGRAEVIPGAIEEVKTAKAHDAVAMIKGIDPTRPVFNHAGANNGDIYNINCYLNFTPLQEREEWLREWARSGDMPLLCCEFGTPWEFSCLRGRWGFDGSTESLMSEYCAIYLGREAYALESADYRKAILQKYGGGQRFGNWINGDTLIESSPAFQKMEALFIRNTWRSWRTWGITGGMVPWDYGYAWDAFNSERNREHLPTAEKALRPFTPGMRGIVREKATADAFMPFQSEGMLVYPAGHALTEVDGPTLAWIAGGKADFTAKDHSFAVGQPVEKQAVLINDERSVQEYRYTWTASCDGGQIATGSGNGTLGPAQTLFIPIRFTAPMVSGKAKADGAITLVARIGSREHQDAFPFRVFAHAATQQPAVALYDPLGKTATMLQALGIATHPWDGKELSALIVIGRQALSSGKPPPGDCDMIIRAGGHVLVCAQDAEWLRGRMGFRVAFPQSRKVFPVAADHPLCQGIDAADLADWSGESTMLDAHGHAAVQDPRWRSPGHGWRWGNLGVVTSAAIEKPHRSGWRPLLECEFDLAYSPLMELDYGNGRLILCTLDLEDHVPLDAAASMLTRSILRYAATAKPIARSKRTILLGDAQDQKTVADLGVVCQASADTDQAADLTIIGSHAAYDPGTMRSLMGKGGKMLFLPRAASDHGFGVVLKEEDACCGSLAVPAWPECQGLSPSDLHWRSTCPAWVLASGVESAAAGLLGRLSTGTGVAIFCQVDPERFAADQKQYFRITRWRQTRALSQILANLGAVFTSDSAAASLDKRQEGIYHPDFHADDIKNSDDPYLYFRW